MIRRFFIFAALLLLPFAPSSRAAFDQTTPEEADAFYLKGNCKKALRAYWMILDSGRASDFLRELAQLRTGYCLLQINRPDEAAQFFANVLGANPDNEEARLRYAQALHQSKKERQALLNALQVEEEPFLTEAILLAAQAELELGRIEDAIQRLTRAKPSQAWRPAFLYWIGVAKFREFDLNGARQSFLEAAAVAPREHWVKYETNGWLDRIHQSEASWHGSLVLGYFRDTNLAQQSVASTNSLGIPNVSLPVPSSYYQDDGYYVGTELSYRIHQDGRYSLSALASANASNYQYYSAYSTQNLSGGLAGSYRWGDRTTLGLITKFLDSRYNYKYYQNYLTAAPSVTLGLTNSFFVYVESPYTWYLSTRHYHSFGISLAARYFFEGWRLFGGAGYTRARGTQATFYSYYTLAYVLSGEMFVNDEVSSRFLGASVDLPWSFYASAQVTWSGTHYDTEALPSGSVEAAFSDREDKQTVFGGELGRVMVPNFWTISLSYNYTHNTSSGLQGLDYSGTQSNYNYNRGYAALKSTLSF